MTENPYSAPDAVNDPAEAAKRSARALRRLLKLSGIVAVVAVLLALLLPAIYRDIRPAVHRTACKNNLKQIMLAMSIYHDINGSFPPAFTVDAEGQPLHSWRTLLLPYIDHPRLYKSIDLSKPWNDPANAAAFSTPMPVFHCPSEKNDGLMTTYQAVVGPGAGFEFSRARSVKDFKDGTSNTILIMEVESRMAVHWMSPFDHGYEYLLTNRPEVKNTHEGGSHAAIADGTVRFLSQRIELPTRRALISIADGDTVGDF
jgi:hypothetical protein